MGRIFRNGNQNPGGFIAMIRKRNRGEVCALITNTNTGSSIFIDTGDRIAQEIFIGYLVLDFMDFSAPERLNPNWKGENGFGHSGIK